MIRKNYKDTLIYKQWHSLKNKYKSIVFFQVGEFYEMIDSDAIIAAPLLNLTLTSRDKKNPDSMPLAGFPVYRLEKYIKILVDINLKVIICNQVGTRNKDGLMNRKVDRIVSYGTITEDDGLSSETNNYLRCVVFGAKESSIASLDWNSGTFTVNTFLDEASTINFIQNCEASEIIIQKNQIYKIQHIDIYLKKYKKNFTYIPSISSNYASNLIIKNKLIRESQVALLSCNGALEYVSDTQFFIPKHIKSIDFEYNNTYLVTDMKTLKDINLIDPCNPFNDKVSFFYYLKKYTCTSMGRRYLIKALQRPLLQISEIEYRQELVDFFMKHQDINSKITKILLNFYDIERLNIKCATNKIHFKDIKNFIISIDKLTKIIRILKNTDSIFFYKIYKNLHECSGLYKYLRKAINVNVTIDYSSMFYSEQDTCYFNVGYNENLDLFVHTIEKTIKSIIEMEKSERIKLNIKNLKIKEDKKEGFYFHVSKSQKNINSVKDHYSSFRTFSSYVKINTISLTKLNDILNYTRCQKVTLEKKIMSELAELILKNSNEIISSSQSIAFLDMILSFSKISYNNKYIKPKILDKKYRSFKVIGIKNPVIEQILSNNINTLLDYVPNNITIDNIKRCIIITGANMGGKTSLMKTVLLTQAISQVGCFISAEKAEISICYNIFSKIGVSDNIAEGLSTYMVECKEINYILQCANKYSLIILDEIGYGTNEEESLFLASSIIDYIIRCIKARLLCTTHNHKLAKLKNTASYVVNYYMKVIIKNNKILFMYNLVQGISNKSFCIHVAVLAGFPSVIINQILKYKKK